MFWLSRYECKNHPATLTLAQQRFTFALSPIFLSNS